MAREKQDYRDIYEDLKSFNKDARMMSGQQVAKYTGLCFNTVKKRYHFDKNGNIHICTLAREMSNLEAAYDR